MILAASHRWVRHESVIRGYVYRGPTNSVSIIGPIKGIPPWYQHQVSEKAPRVRKLPDVIVDFMSMENCLPRHLVKRRASSQLSINIP